MYINAPIEEVFRFTGDPEYWARDYEGEPQPNLTLVWDGKPYAPGSKMSLCPLRKDGTPSPVNSVPMELIHYRKGEEITFRFLTGNHLVYRFVYEEAGPNRTEFTVNVLVGAESSPANNLLQRFYARSRRRNSIKDHMRVKAELEARAMRNRRR